MERISNKSPCLDCCSDRQIGNPDVWQSDCYRCEKLPNWKAKAINRLFDIEDILGDEYDLDRLKELVEADREGRCVLLPRKVGDKLYKISENGVKEVVVQSIVFMLSHTVNHLTVHVANERGAMTEIETKDFGKTVFLTREEAEAALKKMKGGNE